MTTTPIQELVAYVGEHTRTMAGSNDEAPVLVDVHFLKILVSETLDKSHLLSLIDAALEDGGHGYFCDMTEDRLKQGPSYIELGAWVGDQTFAFMFMAAGQIAGLWKVVTPKTVGVEGQQADAMAGNGFVLISGFNREKVGT